MQTLQETIRQRCSKSHPQALNFLIRRSNNEHLLQIIPHDQLLTRVCSLLLNYKDKTNVNVGKLRQEA